MTGSLYNNYVKGKSAEEILAQADGGYPGSVGDYLTVAAQVRSNEDLISALKKASSDSDRTARKIVCLTVVLAVAAVLQCLATALPWFAK